MPIKKSRRTGQKKFFVVTICFDGKVRIWEIRQQMNARRKKKSFRSMGKDKNSWVGWESTTEAIIL